jgi:hypothetical protein
MRVETYSEELIKIMVDAGCVSACFGLESMSQAVLDNMNKKTKTDKLKMAMEVAYQHGGGMCGNLIFGAETESLDTIRETMGWWEKNKKYHMGSIMMIGAYPGSGYYEEAVEKGIISDKRKFIEEKCPFVNLTQLSEWQYKILTAYTRFKDTEVVNKGTIISIDSHKDDLLVDAKLKCYHCGTEIVYKNVRKSTIATGKITRLCCRKCHNYSDYVIDENRHREKWNTAEWLFELLQETTNNAIEKFCISKGYKTVALYGFGGAISEIVMQTLKDSDIKVEYAIDRNNNTIKNKDIPIYGLNDIFPSVDAIIVTPVYYYNTIEKDLKLITDIPIVSLEEVLE